MKKYIFVALVTFMLASKAQGQTRVLTWDPVATCVGGSSCAPTVYKVYRQIVDGGVFTKIADVNAPLTSYSDNSVPAAGTVCHYVTASSPTHAESMKSNIFCGTLAAPTNLR